MVVIGQSDCIQAKVVVLGHKWRYSGKWFYLGKRESNLAKVVLFGQNWFYKGKSGCIRE